VAPSKSPSLASRGSPRARQRRRCCSVRSAVLAPNSVGSDQRAPTTKNESDNSGTEGGVQLLQPAPRSDLQVASCSNLLSAMLALLSSFAFASRDSSLRTSSLEHPPRSVRLPLRRPSRRSTAVGLARPAPAPPSLGFSRPPLPPRRKS